MTAPKGAGGGHTPGPWRYTPWHIEEGNPTVRAPEGWLICETSSDANARLIAAAPELLDAVMAMIEWDDREQDHAVGFTARMALCAAAFEKARAALARATGAAS